MEQIKNERRVNAVNEEVLKKKLIGTIRLGVARGRSVAIGAIDPEKEPVSPRDLAQAVKEVFELYEVELAKLAGTLTISTFTERLVASLSEKTAEEHPSKSYEP